MNAYRSQSGFRLRCRAVRLWGNATDEQKRNARAWITAVQWMDSRKLRIIYGGPKKCPISTLECPPRAA